MGIVWGLIIAAIGTLFIVWGRTRSEFVVYRLLVARSRILWGTKRPRPRLLPSLRRNHDRRRRRHRHHSVTAKATASAAADAVSSSGRRRHDLDALRGFAMLLGIALHASLAFFPAFWAVQDSKVDQDGLYDEFFHAVHGFRMPLFFLLSGFFTTMVWRRRGLVSLVRQRVTRVFIPLAIGAVTIVPLMDWVADQSAASPNIVTAVVVGDADGVQRFIDDGYELEARGEDSGTILHLAAVLGSGEVTEVLLEAGADPNALNFNGATPLGAGAFAFGNEAAADLLVDYGAPDDRPQGQEWTDIEGWGFLADALEAPADERGAGVLGDIASPSLVPVVPVRPGGRIRRHGLGLGDGGPGRRSRETAFERCDIRHPRKSDGRHLAGPVPHGWPGRRSGVRARHLDRSDPRAPRARLLRHLLRLRRPHVRRPRPRGRRGSPTRPDAGGRSYSQSPS